MNRLNFVLLPFLLAPLSSCKSTGSTLSHDWGRTLVPGASPNCQETPAEGNLRLYQLYIREHLTTLAEANPQVFKDQLAAQNFCIIPMEIEDIDAGASPDGSLFINTGVLRAAETDAQFASVIAHELAHITLRHGATEMKEFVDEHPEYAKAYSDLTEERMAIVRHDIQHLANVTEQDWTKYLEQLRSLVRKKWNAAHASGRAVLRNGGDCENIATWEKTSGLRAEIIKKLPKDSNEIQLCHQFFQEFNLDDKQYTLLSNWKETEADEAGYEFFLRAGFPEDEYAQFFQNVSHLSGGRIRECERGESDHPNDCWRASNIRAELKEHAKDLKLTKVVKVHRFKGDLNNLRSLYSP